MAISDWWIVGATIVAGVMAALATWVAVVYTNKKTVENYKNDIERQRKEDAMVIIKPTLMLNSFTGFLDMLIMRNTWHRALLFSGEDGFDFFDDVDKRWVQQCRILIISNESDNDIKSVKITTESKLTTESDEVISYSTNNFTKLLRGKEDVVIRVLNQEQYKKVVELNKAQMSSELNFTCKVEYLTKANQQICYEYIIQIKNDKRIEIIKDEYEILTGVTLTNDIPATVFRNLQDAISSVDRSEYAWKKIGQAQVQGMGSFFQSFFSMNPERKEEQTTDETKTVK